MAGPLYRRAPESELRVAELDDFAAIYHRPSGITHLVTAPVPEILAALADEPLDGEALLARLAAHYDLADADDAALGARLDELVAAGLVIAA